MRHLLTMRIVIHTWLILGLIYSFLNPLLNVVIRNRCCIRIRMFINSWWSIMFFKNVLITRSNSRFYKSINCILNCSSFSVSSQNSFAISCWLTNQSRYLCAEAYNSFSNRYFCKYVKWIFFLVEDESVNFPRMCHENTNFIHGIQTTFVCQCEFT